jgi:hypothetical protein
MTLMLEELREATSLGTPGAMLQKAACDMRELVANVVDSIDDARARRITIETDDASTYEVLANASRLERVIAGALRVSLSGAFTKYAPRLNGVTLSGSNGWSLTTSFNRRSSGRLARTVRGTPRKG